MKTLLEAIYSDGEIIGSVEPSKALKDAVLRLPLDQQKVLTLYYARQVPIKEISIALRCSVTTTYNKLNRALFVLRNELNPAAYEKMYSILYPGTGKPTLQ